MYSDACPLGQEIQECVFKTLIYFMLERGLFPSPSNINYVRGRTRLARPNNINGRETKWRREVLIEAGYTRDERTGRYVAPQA